MSTGNRINKDQVGQRTKTRFGRANVSLAGPADANVKRHSTNIYRGDSKCPCCEETENHDLWKCQKFLGLQVQERRAIVKEGQYCFSCLKLGHQAKVCTSKFRCKECGLPHNTLLHVTKNPSEESKREPRETVVGCATAACKSEVTTMQASIKRSGRMLARPRTRLEVLPVRAKNGETSMEKEILAFLDGGADCHLIRKKLFEELGLKGEAVQSRIGLANGSTSVENTFTTDLFVSGLDGVEFYELLSTIVTETLADISASAPCLEDFDRNPHLVDVKIPIIQRDQVDLIIGLNARILHEIHDRRKAGPNQLCAGKCVLGWFLYGNDCTVGSDVYQETRHACFATSTCTGSSTRMEDELQVSIPKEDLCLVCLGDGSCQDCGGTGSRWKKPDRDLREPSIKDERAQRILDSTCTLVDGHYQVGLLWSSDESRVPDNYVMAKNRLDSLGKRLRASPEVREKYREKVQDMLDQGHAVLVPDPHVGAVPGRTFYIPHHNVASSEKFRIVMDCAATYQGVSLNSVLLRGPDNLNSLLGVLFRFRLYPVAIVADIKSMFFQVRCKPEDRSALRFLFWEDGDPDREIKVY